MGAMYKLAEPCLLLQEWDESMGLWQTRQDFSQRLVRGRIFFWLPWPTWWVKDPETDGDYMEVRRDFWKIATKGASCGRTYRILERYPLSCFGGMVLWYWRAAWNGGTWTIGPAPLTKT